MRDFFSRARAMTRVQGLGSLRLETTFKNGQQCNGNRS